VPPLVIHPCPILNVDICNVSIIASISKAQGALL
jgi:hypothetical protein